jgi:hypothetical protein
MAGAIEEPAYEVLQRLGNGTQQDIEVRRYAPYVVAEVLVPGPASAAGGQAFPILAGYIFGKNRGEQKFAMTAPVTQAVAAPVKMEMTAPVTQAPSGSGFVVQFVLPRSVSLASAPEPLDKRVQLREVPASTVAAIRYSGLWSQANEAEHTAALQAALTSAGMAWQGDPVLSRYNAPFTPWFMRRNEVWLTLR